MLRNDRKSVRPLLQKIVANAPPDTWLAVDCGAGEIIASGPDLLAVLEAARSQGFSSPVLILSPNIAEAAEEKPKMAA